MQQHFWQASGTLREPCWRVTGWRDLEQNTNNCRVWAEITGHRQSCTTWLLDKHLQYPSLNHIISYNFRQITRTESTECEENQKTFIIIQYFRALRCQQSRSSNLIQWVSKPCHLTVLPRSLHHASNRKHANQPDPKPEMQNSSKHSKSWSMVWTCDGLRE